MRDGSTRASVTAATARSGSHLNTASKRARPRAGGRVRSWGAASAAPAARSGRRTARATSYTAATAKPPSGASDAGRPLRLRLPVGLGSDRGGDVGAHLRERAAVRGGKGVETGARDRLARDRAARARVPDRRLPHGPHRVHEHRLTRNRLEALDVDRDPVGRAEVRHERSGGHARRSEEDGEVAGDSAYATRPAITSPPPACRGRAPPDGARGSRRARADRGPPG